MSDRISIHDLDFEKGGGLIPAIIQDASTSKVLMLGYMNSESIEKTYETGLVTFFSRSKSRLWTKGESSNNFLKLVSIKKDCDADALLVKAIPDGPTCHTGDDTCWKEENLEEYGFLSQLEAIIKDRYDNPSDKSYVSSLFQKGINKVAQKVGEEATELIIEAKDDDKDLFVNEAADLLFHYMILLKAKGFELSEVMNVLKERHK